MFGRKLKELRFKNDITQSVFAKILGVSQQAVGGWEKGIAYPNIDTLKQIAKYFNVSIDYLLDNEGGTGTGTMQYNAEEQELLKAYRQLDESDRQMAQAMIYRMLPKRTESVRTSTMRKYGSVMMKAKLA